MTASPAFKRLRWGGHRFKDNLGFIMNLALENSKEVNHPAYRTWRRNVEKTKSAVLGLSG